MIRDGSYTEFADQLIEDMDSGEVLHGGNFDYLLGMDRDPENAARVYRRASELFGPFVTAQAFADACSWNTPEDAKAFVAKNASWPPESIVQYL